MMTSTGPSRSSLLICRLTFCLVTIVSFISKEFIPHIQVLGKAVVREVVLVGRSLVTEVPHGVLDDREAVAAGVVAVMIRREVGFLDGGVTDITTNGEFLSLLL